MREIRIGVVDYPGAQAAAVHGLVDLFETARSAHAGVESSGRALAARVVRVESKPSPSEGPFAALILPPSLGRDVQLAELTPLASWLTARHAKRTLLCSVCAGAFVLGATGLLDGRPATTHWALEATFRTRLPNVQLDTQRIVVDDGDVLTAGGVMAWVDLGLLLVGRFLGPTVALAVARDWVVDLTGREQRFYSAFAPSFTHGDDAIVRVQQLLHARRERKLTVAKMAATAKMTERTFLRRFQRATGHAPTDYVQRLRVERARELLERSALGFEEIAFRLGYSDPGAFRRVFRRIMGLSPGEYRRRFRVED